MLRNGFGRALLVSAASLSSFVLASVPITLISAEQALAGGLPANGQYIKGSGTIAKTGSGLTINQSSNIGIIDWSSFSIANKNSVQFDNGSGATLNRVTGGNLSTIAGSLKSTGSLYLINPQGVIVSRTGRIITGGSFVGASRDESDDDFLEGKKHFYGVSKGTVSNAGTIRSAGGDIALIGNSVSNTGTLSAEHGSASLSAGSDILLAPADGNGHILIKDGTGGVTNRGTIDAAQVQLEAAGGNVYALGGNNGGIIRATGTKTVAGHIWLISNTGDVKIAGTITARNADGSGGTIEATGARLSAIATAKIDASGTRGGTILLGGDVHGGANAAQDLLKDKLPDASITKIAEGADIAANGTKGAGGNVVIWSSKYTIDKGQIDAQASSGHGGFAEVSSGQILGFLGKVNLDGSNGGAGELLLDPENVTISTGTTTGGSITDGTFNPTGANSILNVTTLESALASANVVVKTGSTGTQTGDITVASALAWSSAKTLTLDAYHSVAIDAAVAVKGAGGLTIKTDDGGSGGSLSFIGGHTAFTDVVSGKTQGTLSINGSAYTLANSISQLTSDIAASASGHYALANSYNATADGTYANAPIPTTFTGTFEGLGNTISDLTINVALSSSGNVDIGLFAREASSGVIKDIHLSGVKLTADDFTTGSRTFGLVGTLVGLAEGTIANDSAAGSIAAHAGVVDAGGLIGQQDGGSVTNSSAAVAVSGSNGDDPNYTHYGGWLGGLVGSLSAGSITNSFATGAISVNIGTIGYYGLNGVGGLVGFSHGTISGSYATGAIDTANVTSIFVGGLVGQENTGTISDSYARGAVTDTDSMFGNIGGLVGGQYAATISDSYETGNVSGSGINAKIGGFVGISGGSVANSHATGSVADGGQNGTVGGFAAISYATIQNSYASGAVSDTSPEEPVIGGFVGEQYGGTISSSHAVGDVNGNADGALVGGFAGTTYGTISDDYANGTVSTGSQGVIAGGLVGAEYQGTITGSHATGAVSGSRGGTLGGGLVGEMFGGSITDSYATGKVTETDQSSVGGLLGEQEGGTISVAYATGAVTGGQHTNDGGFVGEQDAGTITDSYASGAVAGTTGAWEGGFAGITQSTISDSYSLGSATGAGAYGLGGFVGNVETGALFTDVYWDTTTSGITDLTAGAGNTSNETGILGQTTAELQSALPTGFSNSIWSSSPSINNGLPYLIALASSY